MKKLFMMCALLAFSFAPLAHASEDKNTTVSYSKKKSGGVPFSSDKNNASQDEAAAAEDEKVADIEPAAGAYEETDSSDDLSKSMKLPRK